MLCKWCIDENKQSHPSGFIGYCELRKNNDLGLGFLSHKIVYGSGQYEHFKWCEDNGYSSMGTVMHRINGPAWGFGPSTSHKKEGWCYNGVPVNCYNLQKDSKTIIGANTDSIGIVLGHIEGKIYEALIGNKKLFVAIKKT